MPESDSGFQRAFRAGMGRLRFASGGGGHRRPVPTQAALVAEPGSARGEAGEESSRGIGENTTQPAKRLWNSLQIAQRARDPHFPTTATTAGPRLPFQCLDHPPQDYILKSLDPDGNFGGHQIAQPTMTIDF